MEGKKSYLVLVERYSGYPFVYPMTDCTLQKIMTVLSNHFFNFNCRPISIRTDSGTQFDNDSWKKFCRGYGANWQIASPDHQQSNALAECLGVKKTKDILIHHKELNRDCMDEICHLRQQYYSGTNASPYLLLFGHRPRGKLPILPHKYQMVDRKPLVDQRERLRQNQKSSWDKHAKELSVIRPGTKVDILQGAGKLNRGRWDRHGVVISQGANLDEYLVEDSDTGGRAIRNRKFLRPIYEKGVHFSTPVSEESDIE